MAGPGTMTAAQFQTLVRGKTSLRDLTDADVARATQQPPRTSVTETIAAEMHALCAIPGPTPLRYRSKTEQRFAERLALLQVSGDVLAWWYEPLTLHLTPNLTYTPDFVFQPPGSPVVPFEAAMPLTLTPGALRALWDAWGLQAAGLVAVEVKYEFVIEERRAFDKLKMAAHLCPQLQFHIMRWQRKEATWREKMVI